MRYDRHDEAEEKRWPGRLGVCSTPGGEEQERPANVEPGEAQAPVHVIRARKTAERDAEGNRYRRRAS